jgi:hypothetical protein
MLGQRLDSLLTRKLYATGLTVLLLSSTAVAIKEKNLLLSIPSFAILEALRREWLSSVSLNQAEELRNRQNKEFNEVLVRKRELEALNQQLISEAAKRKNDLQGYIADAIRNYEAQKKDEFDRIERSLLERETRIRVEYEGKLKELSDYQEETAIALSEEREGLIPGLIEELTPEIQKDIAARLAVHYEEKITGIIQEIEQLKEERENMMDEIDRLQTELNLAKKPVLPKGIDPISSQARRLGQYLYENRILIDVIEAVGVESGVEIFFDFRNREQLKRTEKFLAMSAQVELELAESPVIKATARGYSIRLISAKEKSSGELVKLDTLSENLRQEVENHFRFERDLQKLNDRFSFFIVHENSLQSFSQEEYLEISEEERNMVEYFHIYRSQLTGKRNFGVERTVEKVYGLKKGYGTHVKKCSLVNGQWGTLTERVRYICGE